jgi:putative membrane protein
MVEPNTQDNQTELAKERNRIAADRTLLTWVRTSVSFIGLGFGLGQILNSVGVGKSQRVSDLLVDFLSLLFIGMGVFMAIAAAADYQQELRRLQQASYLYQPRSSLGLIVGGGVVIAAIVTLAVLWHTPPAP